MQKKLLILTGPQGSGNHLWSKIFSKHPDVNGWRMKTYWEGHHHEPFSEWWDDPSLVTETEYQFNVTSISCPYVRNKTQHIPKYAKFVKKAKQFYDVKLVAISRDQNILKTQQERVRGGHTAPIFLKELSSLNPDFFLSTESLFLYQDKYLEYVSKELEFPILSEQNFQSLEDTNKKYIHPVGHQPLDDEVKLACDDS